MDVTVETHAGPWTFALAPHKLTIRGQLPGAFGYDLAAEGYRSAMAAGASPHALLPSAMPVSWMVNNKAPSTVFRAWLDPALRAHWHTLLDALAGGAAHWHPVRAARRAELEHALDALAVQGQGAAAVSKVLALLRPGCVPLMDDAAVWFALGTVARPESADAPSAPVRTFLPMVDWFCAQVLANEAQLRAIARAYTPCALDPSQVLDRLLWFDSWGYRTGHRAPPSQPRFWRIAFQGEESVLPLPGPHPDWPPGDTVPLDTMDGAWAEQARTLLTS